MASLTKIFFNTFLTVCELEDDLGITFTFKIMDLSCFIFSFSSFSSYGRDEGIGQNCVQFWTELDMWQNEWNSSYQAEMSG